MLRLLALLLLPIAASSLTNFADVACGSEGRHGRIVGGEDTKPGEYPWIASITRRGGHFCGGTVIHQNWILTAAHCLCTGGIVLQPNQIRVRVGGYDLRSPPAGQHSVRSITLHPQYTCSRYVDDIALLELGESISWSEMIKPACLPAQASRTNSDGTATAAGWGWTHEDSEKGIRANILQKVYLQIVDNEKCREWYKSQGKKVKIMDTQMCAGSEKGGKDSCWADSGGPLMMTERGGPTTVVGIVSTGIGCARPKLPGLYTRVSHYVGWIAQTLGK